MTATMDHREASELLGAFALDAIDPEERAAVEAHLATCSECRAELGRHWETLAGLAQEGTAAPAVVWDRVAASIEEASAPVVALRRRRPLLPRLLGAAAAIAIIALSLEVVVARGRPATVADSYRAALSRADARRADLSGAGGQAVVVVLPDGTGYLSASGVSDAPPGRSYQLWAISAAHAAPVSAGVLGRHLDVVGFHYAGAVDTFAVSEEVDGGADKPSTVLIAGAVRA
jgi:anti-sigma-K factor RskA